MYFITNSWCFGNAR